MMTAHIPKVDSCYAADLTLLLSFKSKERKQKRVNQLLPGSKRGVNAHEREPNPSTHYCT